MQFIFLIGPPGSGKTVCGRELARLLDCRFFDTDQLIEKQQSCSVSEVFSKHGETHFRRLESELLQRLAGDFSGEGTVVFATGGGLPVFNNNLQRLQQLGKVVALTASLPVLLERVKGNHLRPLLASQPGADADKQLETRLSELLDTRGTVYDLAGYKIDTSGLKPEQVAHEIIRLIRSNN
jgi:shikimate kinase